MSEIEVFVVAGKSMEQHDARVWSLPLSQEKRRVHMTAIDVEALLVEKLDVPEVESAIDIREKELKEIPQKRLQELLETLSCPIGLSSIQTRNCGRDLPPRRRIC